MLRMGWILNIAYLIVLIAATPWMVWRSLRTGRYREGWNQKLLGRLPTRAESEPCFWLHAVSVGEVQLLRTLVGELEKRQPNVPIVVTSTTKSGIDLAKKLFAKHQVAYCPMDFTWAVRNAIRRLRPRMIVLVELELWPNLIRIADQSGCPVAIVNGRLSERSFKGYRRLRWLTKKVLNHVRWIGVQDQTYRSRFVELGARAECVTVTGSMKFDGAESNRLHPEILARQRQLQLTRAERVWVVGSTQEPEEQYAIDAFVALASRYPDLRLIIVPRHPERFEQVAHWIRDSNMLWIRRSEMAGEHASGDWRILLGDTIGELRWWWGLADIGFVGGSFGDRGGQNMIEPAGFGVATSLGPNTWNFRDIVELLTRENAVQTLGEPAELVGWVSRMLDNPGEAASMGDRAKQIVGMHRGATQTTVDNLVELAKLAGPQRRAA
jgi:3-deoxy-D-manno-octulosonic-acid transferase